MSGYEEELDGGEREMVGAWETKDEGRQGQHWVEIIKTSAERSRQVMMSTQARAIVYVGCVRGTYPEELGSGRIFGSKLYIQ